MQEEPLANVTVLDFSQAAAGPYATTLLADMGADVVAIEPPAGGTQRQFIDGAFYPNVARNKRSIAIDILDEGSAEVVRRLVSEVDVVVHNYRPGTSFVEDFGYDYDSLRQYNEDLVYCSITGFGEEGPYSSRPGFDPLAQAMSGLMWLTGEPDRKPSRIGATIVDLGTGVYAAFAIAVALLNREQTGEGHKIEASLYDTAAAFMGFWYTYYSRTGETPTRQGHSMEAYAPVGAFDTADDPVYIVVPLDHIWQRFCRAIDREEWISDPRFETDEARCENREELYEQIEETFGDYTREELVDVLLEAGVPAAELQTVEEAANDEHLRARDAVVSVPDENGEDVLAAGHPLAYSGFEPRSNPPPQLGEHTDEVLASAGFSAEERQRLREQDIVF